MTEPFLFGTVAVGYDGSPHGRDALSLAELMARAAGTRLLAVFAADLRANVACSEEDLAAEVSGLLPPSVAPFDSRVILGASPARVLHELAAGDERIGLLVLGSTHHLVVGGVSPGSVSGKLLNGAPCPVAVAPRGYAGDDSSSSRKGGAGADSRLSAAGDIRVIAVAFDDSPEAHEALRLAAAIGLRCDATLRVIAVGQRRDPSASAATVATSGASSRTAMEVGLEDILHAIVAELPRELRALPVFEKGAPVDKVLGQLELGVDLLLMGSRGYGPLRSVLLGSVSSDVITRASCPVLIAPRNATSS